MLHISNSLRSLTQDDLEFKVSLGCVSKTVSQKGRTKCEYTPMPSPTPIPPQPVKMLLKMAWLITFLILLLVVSDLGSGSTSLLDCLTSGSSLLKEELLSVTSETSYPTPPFPLYSVLQRRPRPLHLMFLHDVTPFTVPQKATPS